MSAVISAENMIKTYGPDTALDSISIDAREGEITGIIGPDGAGKSSFMKIVLGLIRADSGLIRYRMDDGRETLVDFNDPARNKEQREIIRRNVGYMPEVFSLYPDLSVEENLMFSFRIHKGENYRERTEWLYKFNRLKNFSATRAGALSGGMKQKLALSCALMHDPKLLVLDEPTTGVDPLSRREFWSMLHQLKEKGISILVSTPYMEEAVQCDRITLMHKGRILGNGTTEQLLQLFPGNLIEISAGDDSPQELRRAVMKAVPDMPVYLSGRSVRLMCAKDADAEALISKLSDECRLNRRPLRVNPELEDLFVVRVLEWKQE